MRIDVIELAARSVLRGGDIEGTLGYNLDCKGAMWTRPDPVVLTAAFSYRVGLTIKGSEEAEAKNFGELLARYSIVYHLGEEAEKFDNTVMRSFVGMYGFIHLWPYARADFQTLCARLALPPLTLQPMSPGKLPTSLTLAFMEPPTDEEVDLPPPELP